MPEQFSLSVGGVQATLRDVVLPNGLKLDSVSVAGEALAITSDPFTMALKEPGRAEVRLRQPSIEAFLLPQLPDTLRDVMIRLIPGYVVANATMRVMFEMRGTAKFVLRVVGDSELHVEVESVDVFSGVAKPMIEKQLAAINPVFDTKDLPLRLKLSSARIEEGEVIVEGLVEGTP